MTGTFVVNFILNEFSNLRMFHVIFYTSMDSFSWKPFKGLMNFLKLALHEFLLHAKQRFLKTRCSSIIVILFIPKFVLKKLLNLLELENSKLEYPF